MKKTVATLLKIAFPIAILVWLIHQANKHDPGALHRYWAQPKNMPLLATAFAACFVGVLLSFVRWYLLVRSQGIEFRLRDAFRLGFVGYLLQFISFGSVGGDLFKAFFIAKEQPRHRTIAITSIFVDRVVGLYTLLLLTSVAVAWMLRNHADAGLQRTAHLFWGVATMGTVVVLMVLFSRFSIKRFAYPVERIRWARDIVLSLDDALRMYRASRGTILAAIAISVASHTLFATTIFLAARSVLSSHSPSWGQHMVMWPIAGAASALPLSPGGLGTFEATLKYLLTQVATPTVGEGESVIIPLLFRFMTMIVSAVGFLLYWSSRQQIQAAMRDAEEIDAVAMSTTHGRSVAMTELA